MATCYCNDIYREAAKRGIEVIGVEVQANAAEDVKRNETVGIGNL
jgi:hypothetical protein